MDMTVVINVIVTNYNYRMMSLRLKSVIKIIWFDSILLSQLLMATYVGTYGIIHHI